MSEKQNKALRTGIQALVGFVSAEGLLMIWNAIMSNHQLDPSLVVAIGVILSYLTSLAQNDMEEKGLVIPKITPTPHKDAPKAH